MKKHEFIRLHMNLSICLPRTIEFNPLDSCTDPTQDIPIRMIEVTALGEPTNVKRLQAVFSNLPVDQMSSIDKRNNDQFDVLGEYQDAAREVNRPDVKSNFINQHKQKKHE